MWFVGVLLLGALVPTFALENGLARTPPMGWMTWQRFRCNIDCENDPDNCISENLIKKMADKMASEGYLEAGYQYIVIDDCWSEKQREPNGELLADKKRFPSGMGNLSDYVHSLGLKFGIYQDYGTHTCAGYPGIFGHMKIDAETFAKWKVDYVKLDGCNSNPADMDTGYPEFGRYLKETGRNMFFACGWPLFQTVGEVPRNYSLISEHCNSWRNWHDIQDSWGSVQFIVNYYEKNPDNIIDFAGPGHWNDPDMLVIGNFGLSFEQSKTQMALWAIMAAPLIMSNDLRHISDESKAILQNARVIKINQDPLGKQGKQIFSENNVEIWTRPITPVENEFYSYAIAFANGRDDGTPYKVTRTLKELGLVAPAGYHVEDVYDRTNYGLLYPEDRIEVHINPSGVVFLRANVQQ
ncbi:alpha-N-acetylgalactosaminidase-like [Ctenocephalides felis]|uniref:alpha-N-acetylgalactosaminidase-like n=1 Tax=Ctenocephalides felis TaxID=7515 RepID=UPI000E6E570C|nr:alpha-N-acetylgalactosaminidase-like [Ctenocephalides felis]